MIRNAFALVAVSALVSVAACSGDESDEALSATSAPTTIASAVTSVEDIGHSIESNLEYATVDGVPLTLDVHVPVEPVGAPILVTEGFEEIDDGLEEIEYLVDEDVIVVHVNDFNPPIPPVGPDQPDNRVGLRGGAEVFACAIRFVRERASALGTDDPSVALMSLSVGGGGVAHAALFGAEIEAAWDGFAAAGGPPGQVECGSTGGSSAVDGLIGVAGAYDLFVPVFEGRFGLSYQQEHDPELQQFLATAVGTNTDLKVRLFHDPNDSAIPLENSTMFESALAEAGYDVEVITFDGGHNYPPAEMIVPVLLEVTDR